MATMFKPTCAKTSNSTPIFPAWAQLRRNGGAVKQSLSRGWSSSDQGLVCGKAVHRKALRCKALLATALATGETHDDE
jgi:hypothetical protein